MFYTSGFHLSFKMPPSWTLLWPLLLRENSWDRRSHNLALASWVCPVIARGKGQPSLHHLIITRELSHVIAHSILVKDLEGKDTMFMILGLRFRAVWMSCSQSMGWDSSPGSLVPNDTLLSTTAPFQGWGCIRGCLIETLFPGTQGKKENLVVR